MKEIRRLIHNLTNVLTSARGFIDLALSEPERSKRYRHIQLAIRELNRAVKIMQDLSDRIEVKATEYGEGRRDVG